MGEQLYEIALEAIRDLFESDSPVEETIENLKSLKAEIDILLETLSN